MSVRATLERLGFDTARLDFTMRTAFAACLAVLLAWLVGLEHPQWSGMTVWSASQPVRGLLLEKSFFRALGTVIGSIFGVILLIAAGGEAWPLVVGLSIWIGLCAGASNVLRGFVSYGAITAGYTAAMVSLLHSAQSAGPLAVGLDRMLTVLVGVLVALAVGWMFAAPGNTDDPLQRLRGLSRRILDDLANHLAGKPPDRQEHKALLSEMAAIEDTLDSQSAGSVRSRQAVKAIRGLMLMHVAVLLWMRRPLPPGANGPLIAALQDAARAGGDPARPEVARAALHRAAALAADPLLREALSGLADAEALERGAVRQGDDGEVRPVTVLHRDWIGARETLLRTALTVFAVGAIWLGTGWEGGSFMLLGTSVMATVFSTADNPASMLRQSLIGQTLAVASALVCRWLVWPAAGGEIGLVFGMMPFILFGGALLAHRRTMGPAFDYNMVVLLLLQPAWPLAGDFAHSLTLGAAVVLGPAIGLLAFMFLFPVSGRRRMRTLLAMMVHEVEAMAARPGVSRRRPVWRARLYHRVLKLVRWADKTGANRTDAVECGYALLLAGSSALHMDEALRQSGLAPNTTRHLELARARLSHLGRDPRKTARTIASAADRLVGDALVDTALLRETAAELRNCAAFIQKQADPSAPGRSG